MLYRSKRSITLWHQILLDPLGLLSSILYAVASILKGDDVISKTKWVPLTHAETRIYLTQKLHPESCMWNVPVSLRLTMVDLDRLHQALLLVINSLPGLHVVFSELDGVAHKRVVRDLEPVIEFCDFSEKGEQAYLQWAQKQAETPLPMFDLLPYRLAIADVGGKTGYLFTNYHHIAVDGGSSDLVFRRVITAYEALGRGETVEFPPSLPLSAAYDSEQAYFESAQCEDDKHYWNSLFENVPDPMDIAGKPVTESLKLSSIEHRFSTSTSLALLDYCSENKVSPFRVMLATMALVLSRTLRRKDIVIGTATANRHPVELHDSLGMYVNTCGMRLEVEPDITFDQLVKEAGQCVRNTIARERYPYDRLASDIRGRTGEVPDLAAYTLVEMVRTPYANYAESILHYHGESLIPLAGFFTYPHRDAQNDTTLHLKFMFHEELYEPWRINQLISHLEQAILAGITSPDTPVRDINFLTEKQYSRLVFDFNETCADWEVDTTLHGSIAEIARRYPGHTAVVYRGASLTYAELEARSSSMAQTLKKYGAEPGKVVGLLADRSIEIIIAQLAILKSGSAFMPIDAGYPDSRIQFMLEDIAAPLILTQSRFIDERDFGDAVIVNMDDSAIYASDDTELQGESAPDDLAIVIYTSGSTGNPKGVLLEHRAICNTIHATIRDHGITPDDNLSKHASFSFDASMLEVFCALMSGATLHILPDEIRLSLSHLNEYFEANRISWAFLTTQLGEQFIDFIDNKSLRVLIIGGEKMRIFTLRNYQLINAYGPTECSIYATQKPVDRFDENIPIGRPVPNFRIYILDNHGSPQPPGYGGELCIGGPGVARGYHNRPEKNAECFVEDSFHPGERMYRTGDLACWTPDGEILHLGRMDRQVKLRGFRIELGEIENAMLSINGVNEAAVTDFKDSGGHVYLCGYICGDIDPEAVTACLDGKMPPFMIPTHMLRLEAMPINPSGKIDRKKLPEPKVLEALEDDYQAPETELEGKLCTVWEEVLERNKVGVNLDFFQGGGDSLRAVVLQLTIDKQLGREVDLSAIFECPTPRLMASYLEESKSSFEQIVPAEPAEFYPATVSQQQLFLLNSMKGIGTAYNMPMYIAFHGKLDHKRLSQALLTLVERHEALRTSFEIRDGACAQRVLDSVHLKLDFGRTEIDDPTELAAGFLLPFDLSRPPLMRAKLVARKEDLHWLLLDFHHIAFDGVSVGIYLRELLALYKGEQLEPLPLQHKDVAFWERNRADDICSRHESFWHDLFETVPESDFPTDFQRPGHQDFAGATYRHQLDTETSNTLRIFARQHKATLHQIFMVSIGILAGRWSESEDICLGTSMSGRDRAGTTGIVGMFVRTLPTRIRPEYEKTFAELLAETRQQMLEVHEHGEYPISSLYEHLGVNRGPGRHPMFDINFVMRNIGADDQFELEGLRAEVHSIATRTAKFDISIAAEEDGENIVIEFDYRTSLYRRETISRLANHLNAILAIAAISPDIVIGEIEMLGVEERDVMLKRFNPKPTPAPPWKTVCQAIEEQARLRPDHIAVKAENGSLTYGELNRLANRGARAIAAAGGGRDRIVAVVADRSTWSVAGMLAALKSGSAYVGLDTHYPPDRVAFILKDTDAPCIVGVAQQLADVTFDCPAVVMDELVGDDSDPALDEGGDALAYCIFTSGSTGKPKGVLIEHQSMINFIHWYADHHQMGSESGCAAFAAFSFDVSVVQIFAPLVSGATLHVIPEALRRSPKDLEEYFDSNSVTNAHFPTQFAEQFMRMCDPQSLKYLVVGGDRLKSYELTNYRLTNEYGPSETTMACLSYDVPTLMAKPPVGFPIANTRIYILDKKNRLCPIGVPGEICVSGIQVGRGYLNRPELTQKHFVDDPFLPGERMFRTGDKGKWLEDGTIDFIGRMDFQVKIRGYRVEPGEIESRIKEMPDVLDCVVVPIEEPNGSKVLAAYCTASSELDAAEVKAALKSELPEYMVPAHIIQLDKMPLSPNGKVERGKLPRPEITATSVGPLEPRNPKEARIAQAWEKVLGHRGFGLFDSFYDIGGDSLSAITLLADLSETFDISASDLFAHTTIAEQASHFQEAEIGRSARLMQLKKLADPPAEDPHFVDQQAIYDELRQKDGSLDTETVRPFEHVLLTGATGTLGVYLLRELLLNTDAGVTAVVRGENDEAALQRLQEHYQDRFDSDMLTDGAGRLQVLVGDLGVEGFGMEQEVFQKLEVGVDTILHSAALTSHYGEWETFEKANITSVENLARFARKGREKVMHHISTTSIGAGRVEGRSQVLFTEFDVDMGQDSKNSYVRSKLLSEVVLDKLRAEGLPISVYRAGNITCDSQTGTFQRNVEDNAFYQQLRAYVNLGVAPDLTDVRNMSYVDQSATAIISLMERPGLVGQTFHIHNPLLLSLSEALAAPELGLRLKRLGFNDFIEFFAGHAGCPGFDEYIERILLHLGWQDWLANPAGTGTVIRVERTVDLLERCGFSWKQPEPDDLRMFVRHALADRVERLKSIPGFSTLDEEALVDIAARVGPEYFGETVLLQQEKTPVDGVRFVMEGMVETYRHNATGWVGTVRVGGPGACLGEEAVLEDCAAINSVESHDETFAFQFTLEDVRELTARHPRLGLVLLGLANKKADQAERLFVAV